MIYNKIKAMIAKKMKNPSYNELDDFLKPPKKRHSMYMKGKRDYDNGPGHGRYKGQGLTNYIDDMLEREKKGERITGKDKWPLPGDK